MRIESHIGPYEVFFDDDAARRLNESVPANAHFIIDNRVAEL
jgi:3-dehydroquinate synthase